MSNNKLKWLQSTIITTIVLMVVQFEFGMAVNLSDLPSLSPIGYSFQNVLGALNQAGIVAVIHAALGSFLVIVSGIGLIMAVNSKIRSAQIFNILGFLSMALAEVNGVLFTLSGFQNDNYSHGMASMFILTFGLYFLELYFLKPTQNSK